MKVTAKSKKNLKPVRTKSEARKRGRNGGIKSGESRRIKKTRMQTLISWFNLSITDNKLKEKLEQMGLPADNGTMFLLDGLKQAKNNARMYETFLRLLDPEIRDAITNNKTTINGTVTTQATTFKGFDFLPYTPEVDDTSNKH